MRKLRSGLIGALVACFAVGLAVWGGQGHLFEPIRELHAAPSDFAAAGPNHSWTAAATVVTQNCGEWGAFVQINYPNKPTYTDPGYMPTAGTFTFQIGTALCAIAEANNEKSLSILVTPDDCRDGYGHVTSHSSDGKDTRLEYFKTADGGLAAGAAQALCSLAQVTRIGRQFNPRLFPASVFRR